MAFTKQPKLCQDAPAGVETFNRLNDNLDSLRADFEREHLSLDATDGQAESGPPAGAVDGDDPLSAGAGAHDHPLIPRGFAYVRQVTTDPTLASTYGVGLANSFGCLQLMTVIDVGVYFFPVSGLSRVWGHATIHPEQVNPILAGIAQHISVQASDQGGTGATGLVVRTLRLQENDDGEDELLPFHTGFNLVAYGRRGEAPTLNPGVQPIRRTRFAAGPRGGPARFPRPRRR